MRRFDREITDKKDIKKILDESMVMRIGFIDNEEVYIVPVNFGYKYDDKLELYLHGANQGRKYDLLLSNPKVTIELDTQHQLLDSDIACEVSYYYSSIIGVGHASIITDLDEKLELMLNILKHQTAKDFKMDKEQLTSTLVSKIVIDKLSCKRHKKN
jgi:nitroimidazol reductase NimA-like FMN-containing flavoprotein (pyridoxamine 5'-phosphate oxidase superfamily)